MTKTNDITKSSPDFKIKAIKNLKVVAKITGADSINRTDRYGVCGTDLGSMVEMGENVYFVFGDTFDVRGPEHPPQGGAGTKWRSNVIAVSSDKDPSDGITFDTMILDEQGIAKEVILSKKVWKDEFTAIPTGGFSINNKLYLTFMSIKKWGKAGVWTAKYGGMARSDDGGQNWTKLNNMKWPARSNFTQACSFIKDGILYIWSTPAGRYGGVKLMKTSVEKVEVFSKYLYYSGQKDGQPVWSPKIKDAVEIIPPCVGELSIVWNHDLERWLMMNTRDPEHSGIVLREGITPWGPWSDPIEVVNPKDYPQLYGSYMLPKYFQNMGKTIYFTMSQWLPYNVNWMKYDLVIE